MAISYRADDRRDYGENQYIGIGEANDQVIVIVFTMAGEETYRIISMRKAGANEKDMYYGS